MALISCSKCGKQISDRAAACPHCGAVPNSAQPVQPVQRIQPSFNEIPELTMRIAAPQKSKTPLIIGLAVGGVALVCGIIILLLTVFRGGEPSQGHSGNSSAVTVGTLTLENGDIYAGEIVNSLPDGNGKMTYTTGEIYNGEWVKGKRNGQGTLSAPNGYKYTGEWKNDKQHGRGIETFDNGDKYVGELENGLKSGQGRFTFGGSGNYYEGGWKDNEPFGEGTLYNSNGSVRQSGIWNGW